MEENISNKDNHDRIELRSEKVRNIIGAVPPALVRWGIAIITLILLLLVAAVCLLPYPYGGGKTILQYLISQ